MENIAHAKWCNRHLHQLAKASMHLRRIVFRDAERKIHCQQVEQTQDINKQNEKSKERIIA